MTTVTDLKDVDVEVVEDDDEDVCGGGGGGGESVGRRRRPPRADALRDSVVARLLMDSRPPRLHAASTGRRDVVARALRSLPPPVDLSAAKSVAYDYEHLPSNSTCSIRPSCGFVVQQNPQQIYN